MRLPVLLAALLAMPACTSRHWFEGMQERARLQCQQNPDPEAARQCREEVDRRQFEAYQRDRPK